MNTKYLILFAFFFFINTSCFSQNNGAVMNAKNKKQKIALNTTIDRVQKTMNELHNPNGKKVLVVMHRGDWRNYPENSILSLKGAIEIGTDIVETDVALTKDGVPIIMHDKTVDRTTTGKGDVNTFTLDSLMTLNLRNGYGVATIYKVPTLKEFMETAKGKVVINLDKCYGIFNEIYEVLKETGTINHVVMKGPASYEDFLKKYPNSNKGISYMTVVEFSKKDHPKLITNPAEGTAPVAYELIFSKDTVSELNELNELKKNGSRVWVNSLWGALCGNHDDDKALTDISGSYGWLIEKGFNMIQTDRPQLLLNYLRSKGLHD